MTNLPDRSQMRASDSDRDRVAAIIREAAAEGRLRLDELDDRLEAVYAAQTYAELEPIVRDLPTQHATSAPASTAYDTSGARESDVGIAIMSGFRRRGTWLVPRKFTAFAFWGGGQLDFREARFSGREVRIRAIAIMGGFEIIVPPDAEVDVRGIGIMGGFDDRAEGAGRPGAPRIVVSGFAFWGGVGVIRKSRKRKDLRDNAIE